MTIYETEAPLLALAKSFYLDWFWNTNVGAVNSIMLFFYIRLKRKIDQNENYYFPFRKRFQ